MPRTDLVADVEILLAVMLDPLAILADPRKDNFFQIGDTIRSTPLTTTRRTPTDGPALPHPGDARLR